MTATRIGAGEVLATVVSRSPAVTRWALRYFGPWWNAVDAPLTADQDVAGGPVVVADVDPRRFADLAGQVTGGRHEETGYAGAAILLARGDDGSVCALSPKDELAYRREPSACRILIVGAHEQAVSMAAARLARDAVRAVLQREGWTVLHASAVVRDGHAALAFGGKGAGKTTTALLARYCGWKLLANDRIFVRTGPDGVQILPGHRAPLHEPDGRELKAQVFPDQLHTWFGLPLAASGRAAVLLFPTVDPDAVAARAPRCRSLTEADFFSTRTEDRYPDIFGLALTTAATRERDRVVASEHLAGLPHHTVNLGHQVTASAHVLNTIVGSI